MPTNLLSLPLVAVEIETATNEDWRDAIQFLDPDGNPISIAGITFNSILRPILESAVGYVPTSTAPSWQELPRKGEFLVGGDGNSVLGWNVTEAVMSGVPAQGYVMDVVGVAPEGIRRVITGTVNVVRGVTR